VSGLHLRRAIVAVQGWTREGMKDNIEVWYRLRRTDGHAGKAA
jgi:hypothetical protein